MPNIVELKQKKGVLYTEARAILDANPNGLSGEPEERYGKIEKDIDALDSLIAKYEKLGEVAPETRSTVTTPEKANASIEHDEYRNAFNSYCRKGVNGLYADELRKMSVGTNSEGGYTVPTFIANKLVQKANDLNFMRGLASVIKVANGNFNIPIVSAHGAATYGTEEGAYADTTETFGSVNYGAYKLQTMIKVSEELLNDSVFDVESYIINEFGRRFGAGEEATFVNGTGTGQPQGVFVGGTAATTTAVNTGIASDELIDLFHSLRPVYRNNATWIMNDTTAKIIRKLKDGMNNYLWQPGLAAGQPDRLFSCPVCITPYAPTFAASAKVIAFGDMSYYWIVDRSQPVIQRLNELYAANGQVGIRGYMRNDGKLSLTEAVQIMTVHV